MGKLNFFTYGLLITGAVLTTGCLEQGSSPVTQPSNAAQAKICSTCFAPAPIATPSPTATPTAPPTSIATGTDPIIETKVRGVGYSTVTFKVKARNKLKIRFKPGVQDTSTLTSGFFATYTQLGVYLMVGDNDQPTPMLPNGAGHALGLESPTLDFSGQIPKNCPASEAACRETVTITVHKPNYDYWCYNYAMYCSWTHVFESHPWNGELRVETDDTVALDRQ